MCNLGSFAPNPLVIVRHPEFRESKLASSFMMTCGIPYLLRKKGRAFISCHTRAEAELCLELLSPLLRKKKTEATELKIKTKLQHPKQVYAPITEGKWVEVKHDAFFVKVEVLKDLDRVALQIQVSHFMDLIGNKSSKDVRLKFTNEEQFKAHEYKKALLFITPFRGVSSP